MKFNNHSYELTDNYTFDVVFSADVRMVEDEFEVYRPRLLGSWLTLAGVKNEVIVVKDAPH